MVYYENNIKALEVGQNALYNVFMKTECSESLINLNVSKIESKDGSFSMIVTFDEQTIRLNSSYRPLEEARKWAEAYTFPNINTVIEMYGLGNGFFCRELLKRMKKDDVLIIYEPNIDIFQYAIHNFDLTDILQNANVFLFVNELNEYEMEDCLLQKVQWYNMEFQVEVAHPQYQKMNREGYLCFHELIRNNNELAIINKNTDAAHGKKIVEYILKNIKHLKGSGLINELKNRIPKNIPAIIVSAGPSLGKNIEVLKQAKGKSIIIAVDTALPHLERYGIEPDFFITVDPNKSMRHFQGEYAKKIPLIAKLESKSDVLENNMGMKFFYNSHAYIEKLYDHVGIITNDYNTGGSVASAAFSVCVSLERERIIFVGQDLAYDGEFTHIGNRKETNMGNHGMREIEGVNGKLVRTRYDWLIYLQWFENSIRINPEIDFIDATEGGAVIHGTRIMTLKEVVGMYCISEFEVNNEIMTMDPTLSPENEEEVHLYLRNTYEELLIIQKRAEEILGIVYKIIALYKKKGITKEIQKLTDKIQKISNEIEGKDIYLLIDTYMAEFARNHLDEIYKFNSEDSDDTLKTFLLTRDMYQNIIEVTKELQPLVHKTVEEFNDGRVI